MKSLTYYASPVGRLTLIEEDGALTHLLFDTDHGQGQVPSDTVEQKTEFLSSVESQLDEYFAGRRKDFDIALKPSGTAFQLAAWEALTDIPYGETRSYGQQAAAIGKPKAARAVGGANNKNPISIIVP